MDEPDKAAACFEEDLKRREEESSEGRETVEACLFLARYYFDKKISDKAKVYAERLMESHGSARRVAKAIIDRLK